MVSRKRPRAEHQPQSVSQPTAGRSRGEQTRPVEPLGSPRPPPRRSSRIQALKSLEEKQASTLISRKKQQQSARPDEAKGPTGPPTGPKPTAHSKPAAKPKRPKTQQLPPAERRKAPPDHSPNQTSRLRPAEPLQRGLRRLNDRKVIDSVERRTESWVQSMQSLSENGAMAPQRVNSAQRQHNKKAGRPPNPDVERVGASEIASDKERTDQFTEASNMTSRTGAMYKSKECHEHLRRGNGLVHMYMSEQKLFPNRRGPYHGLSKESEKWIQELKNNKQKNPTDGLFQTRGLVFLLDQIKDQTELAVTQNLQDLVCPVVAKLAALHLDDERLGEAYDLLADRWNEQWVKLPTVLPGFGGPKPDYCVGFSPSSFTVEQQKKLDDIAIEKSVLRPTALLYFPFLTCEVKSWQQSIQFAENQNGHNTFVAVLGMVELFRMAEMDVGGQILAFSISYNHNIVCMHTYYPIIDGEKTTVCRHSLGMFLLSPNENPDWWRSWRLVRNVYELWAPDLHRRLCRAIDSVNIDQEAAVGPVDTTTRLASVIPMDYQGETTPRPDDVSMGDHESAYGGGRAVPIDSEQQPAKKPRIG